MIARRRGDSRARLEDVANVMVLNGLIPQLHKGAGSAAGSQIGSAPGRGISALSRISAQPRVFNHQTKCSDYDRVQEPWKKTHHSNDEMSAPSASSEDPEKGGHRDGYPSLAAWIAHDPDNESFVFRKFDRLGARNLLNLQSQLISLESKIERLDNLMRNNGDPEVLLSLARWETYEERTKDPSSIEYEKMMLEKELKDKIKEYRKLDVSRALLCMHFDDA